MNKRKASADRNTKQRASARRPSVSSLYTRPQMGQQKLKPEKSPSTQMLLAPAAQNLSKQAEVGKPMDTSVPKTRFSSQDRSREIRSYSSPRLKYFPAEQIKKFESPPNTPPMGAMIAQQNPYNDGTYYDVSDQYLNNGQGDAATTPKPLHQHRPPQAVQSVGQQQVASHPAIYQAGQVIPRSESVPPQIFASQSHRPFVPHGSNDQQKPGVQSPHAICQGPVCAISKPQVAHQGMNPVDQPRSKSEEPINVSDLSDFDKQPVGGRNNNYRQTVNKLMQPQTPMDPNEQQLRNYYLRSGQLPQNPQQVYQQMQQNMQQQMQMQQKAMNYQMQGTPYNPQQVGRYYSTQGMTSPQDATVNHMRNTRSMHQEPSMNPQWTRNNQRVDYSSIKAQLKPYNVEVVGNNAQQHPVQQHPVHQHPVQQHPMQQHPVQQHPMQQHRQVYNPGQTAPMAYYQPGLDQQMAANQQQANPDLQPPAEKTQAPRNEKKPLQFTMAMLRDQEKLLNTMKQQRVPLEIMRRQFDALLVEQRKHLEFLDFLQRQDEGETKKEVVVPRRKKNIDEKPEWMAHLTPSRISYFEMDKLRQQHKKGQESQQLQQQNPNEAQQVPPQPQTQPYQMWQPNWQQNATPQVYNNAYPRPYVVPEVKNQNPGVNPQAVNYQPQQMMPQYQYPVQQYNQQPQQPQQTQQQYQYAVAQQNQQQMMNPNEYSAYQEVSQPVDRISLLKLRQYNKEVLPQKRNNGLQDPEVARRQLEELRVNAEARKDMEYLANFARKRAMPKLNGIQDNSDMEAEIQKRFQALTSEPPVKRVSANGLENTRNPDNPPQQRISALKRMEQEFLLEYPRQKVGTSKNIYNVQAERENGTVANEQQPSFIHQQQLPVQNPAEMIQYNEKNFMTRGNVQPFRFDNNQPQHYQQMQQYYQNAKNLFKNHGEGDTGLAQRVEANKSNFERAGGDTGNMEGQMTEGKVHFQATPMGQFNIHEQRTIGGVRYLARKQDYLPNQPQMVAPEVLMASRHLQAPVIY